MNQNQFLIAHSSPIIFCYINANQRCYTFLSGALFYAIHRVRTQWTYMEIRVKGRRPVGTPRIQKQI